ncbi:phosphoribosylamine--glycine ligase [Patescibacteria group bacterium]|nr:phosphoribosylamine--glycine ligase [Patescibacteria group bacterium]
MESANSPANNKKKFLFVSYDALITDIVWQIAKEGHEVKYYIDNKDEADIGDGFVDKSTDWKTDTDWADVVVFDDVLGFGTEAAKLRESGKSVVGGTPYTDRLEDDRSFGQEELKSHGVNIIPYKEFTDFDEGIEYIKQNPDEYVIKPSGEAQNHKGLLFVGIERDGSDVIRMLEAYKRVWSDVIKVYQLQRKMNGVEVAVGAFFNGHKFIYPINVNFEHKKLFPGNIGPSTGEMGTSMFWSDPNKLFNSTLKKMEETLARERYVGYIDLNCIVNGYGIYPLEFTSRFGYPTISIQQEGMITPIGDFFYGLATGEDIQLKTKKGFQVGARVVVAPFPFRDKKTFEQDSKGATIVFKHRNGKDPEGVHIEDIKQVSGEWVVTGSSGTSLIVVGTGPSMKQAQQQMYNRIQNVALPNMYYRDDIGDRWQEEDSDRLHSWGYLREQ